MEVVVTARTARQNIADVRAEERMRAEHEP
jgi:hypothetical protein